MIMFNYGRFNMFVSGFCLAGGFSALIKGDAIWVAIQLLLAFLNWYMGITSND